MTESCKSLIDSMNGIIWEARPDNMEITYIGENVSRILGYTQQEWLSDSNFWINHTYGEDLGKIEEFLKDPVKHNKKCFNFRMIHASGKIISMTNFISPTYEGDKLVSIAGVLLDANKKTLLENLEHLEKQVLQLNADHNTSLEKTLKCYASGLEQIFPDMKCSILRIQDGKAFDWASPSLPADYVAAINGLATGPNSGSCGTAAYTGKLVIVSDIEHDKKWADFKVVALPAGLKACWSQPIINTRGVVIATFAMYYDEVKEPNEEELTIIDRSAAILRVIMENKLYANLVEELNAMATQGQELANFGTWQWDFKTGNAKWSDSLCKIYGVDPAQHVANFESYLAMVHPGDKERIKELLGNAHGNKSEITFEERIIRSDGALRNLRSWFKVVADEQGKPMKFIGASMDITQSVENNLRMEQIAWQQSHIVRAPLARIMGLVDLIKVQSEETNIDQQELMDALLESAHELDKVIREISLNTQK
jgi:PAS domain-containing protein